MGRNFGLLDIKQWTLYNIKQGLSQIHLKYLFNLMTQDPCFNDDICCIYWAEQNECSLNKEYMNEFCRASCGQCEVVDKANLRDGEFWGVT